MENEAPKVKKAIKKRVKKKAVKKKSVKKKIKRKTSTLAPASSQKGGKWKEDDERRKGRHLFPKGVSGNPGGRPPAGKALTEVLREMMSAKEVDIQVTIQDAKGEVEIKEWKLKATHDFNHVVAMSLIQRCVNGDTNAMAVLWDRLEGKPLQATLTAEVGTDGELKSMTIEEKQSALSNMMRKALE